MQSRMNCDTLNEKLPQLKSESSAYEIVSSTMPKFPSAAHTFPEIPTNANMSVIKNIRQESNMEFETTGRHVGQSRHHSRREQ